MKEENKAQIILIGSMLIFGSVGVFRKFTPLPSSVLSLARGIIGTLFIALMILVGHIKEDKSSVRKNLLLLALSGALIGFNWVCLFEAYRYTSVAIATLSYYTSPMMVILLLPFVLHEKAGLKKQICVLLSLVGMFFVSGVFGVGISKKDIRGILLGLCAALLYAGCVLINSKIIGINAYYKTLIQLFFASAVLLPYVFLTENIKSLEFTPKSLIMAAIMGIVHTGIAYTLYFFALGRIKTSSVAVLSFTDPVSAIIFSVLFLNEIPEITVIIGAVLILGSALVSEINFKKRIINGKNRT